MAYTDILAQIKAAVEDVADIGRVHDYVRDWGSDREFLNLFEATIGGVKQIRGWTITRDAVPENSRYATGGHQRMRYLFVIRGYLSMRDSTATEKTMQALVDSVLAALDNAVTLSNTVRESGPATAPEIDHREFGTVVCHYAEIHFPVVEHVARTYS